MASATNPCVGRALRVERLAFLQGFLSCWHQGETSLSRCSWEKAPRWDFMPSPWLHFLGGFKSCPLTSKEEDRHLASGSGDCGWAKLIVRSRADWVVWDRWAGCAIYNQRSWKRRNGCQSALKKWLNKAIEVGSLLKKQNKGYLKKFVEWTREKSAANKKTNFKCRISNALAPVRIEKQLSSNELLLYKTQLTLQYSPPQL